MLLRTTLRRIQRYVPATPPGTTILAYHLVGAGTDSPVDISLPLFRRHLEQLSGKVRGLGAVVSGEMASASSSTVVLTFDDAYANFYRTVYPLLLDYQLPATLYVPVSFVDGTAPPPIAGTDGLPACSWAQLRAMQASGLVTLGAHTCTHPSLTQVSPLRAQWEIATSRQILEDKLGASVTSFCYPRALWSRPLEAIVKAHYETAVIGGGVQVRPTTDPYRLQRVSLRRDSPANLTLMLERRVWLEEWAANQVRRARDRWG